jgi:hypothetical protein
MTAQRFQTIYGHRFDHSACTGIDGRRERLEQRRGRSEDRSIDWLRRRNEDGLAQSDSRSRTRGQGAVRPADLADDPTLADHRLVLCVLQPH